MKSDALLQSARDWLDGLARGGGTPMFDAAETAVLGAPSTGGQTGDFGSFSIDEVRELDQSVVARVTLQRFENEQVAAHRPPLKLFLKVACVDWMKTHTPGKSDDKWRITLASFANEMQFLSRTAVLAELRALGVYIPRTFAADCDTVVSNATVFKTLVEQIDFSQYHEVRTADETNSMRILTWLAK